VPFAVALVSVLSACNDPAPADRPADRQMAVDRPVPPVANRESASQPADLPRDYAELREAAKALDLPGHDGRKDLEGSDGAPNPIFDVIDCAEDYRSVEPGSLPPDEEQREALARRAVMLERGLRDAGYDEAVFAGPLRDYETRMLAVIARKGVLPEPSLPAYFDEWFGNDARSTAGRPTRELAHLALAIDAVRQRRRPDLPAVEARGECGAGEQPFLIRSAPAGAKIWLATRFGYNLCTVRRIDGWDRDRCPRWSEMDPSVPAALSGTYMYQAKWPDGRTARGNRTLDGLNPTTDDGTPVVVTIRPD
jgi:hypothetical protein